MSTALTAVLIMCKIPYIVPCKTRMKPDLSEEQCAGLQDALLMDTLDMMRILPFSTYVAYAPLNGKEYFDGISGIKEAFPQTQGDLGQRLIEATNYVFSKGFTKMLVIGGDCPELQPTRIQEASQALDSADVCIGPTDDGGYYLIGLKKPTKELFTGIDWSTERVFQQTYAATLKTGATVCVLPQGRDVDLWEDLVALHHKMNTLSWEKRPNRTENFIRKVMEKKVEENNA